MLLVRTAGMPGRGARLPRVRDTDTGQAAIQNTLWTRTIGTRCASVMLVESGEAGMRAGRWSGTAAAAPRSNQSIDQQNTTKQLIRTLQVVCGQLVCGLQ